MLDAMFWRSKYPSGFRCHSAYGYLGGRTLFTEALDLALSAALESSPSAHVLSGFDSDEAPTSLSWFFTAILYILDEIKSSPR